MVEAEEIRGNRAFSSVSRDPTMLCFSGEVFPANIDRKTENGVGGGGEEEDIELSLGLSLNGKFGVDPNRAEKLKRSSSISNLVVLNGEETVAAARGFSPPHAPPLGRTCSLPAAETEEWRKRKETQSQKRMEAKRKRMEKMKNVRNVKEKLEKDDHHLHHHCQENGNFNGNGNALPSSQGSSVSQGSGSSGISDFDSQPLQGCSKNVEERSPSSVHSTENEPRPAPVAPSTAIAEPAAVNNGPNPGTGNTKEEMLRSVMLNMPCVSTKGDGPNGKKIEGFLYRYRKGEEIRIVCVCHGSFLSPAEFVKHAGGGDVAHPLKHIVVTPSCFF